MNNHDIIDTAIKRLRGKRCQPGTVVAHPSDKIAYTLDRYEEETAVVYYDNIIKRFPASEIFDVNEVKDYVVELHRKRLAPYLDGRWMEHNN